MARRALSFLVGSALVTASVSARAGPPSKPIHSPAFLQSETLEAQVAEAVPAAYRKLTREIAEDLLEQHMVALVPHAKSTVLKYGTKKSSLEKQVVLHHNKDQPFLAAIAKDPELRKTIDFWRQIEFEMGPDEALLYDLRDGGVIYGRTRFPEGTPDETKDGLIRRARNQLLGEVRAVMKHFAKTGTVSAPQTRATDAVQSNILEAVRMRAASYPKEQRRERTLAFFKQSGALMRGKIGKRDWNRAAFRYAGRYLQRMSEVFVRHGLPADYVFIAAVESHFNPFMRSPAGAYGVWQFMPYTARVDHRMNVSREEGGIDERRSPLASVVGAAEYLALKREEFANPDLTAISYNQGNYVRFAIRHAGTNDPVELLKILKADRGRHVRDRVVPKRFDAGMKYLPRAVAMQEGFAQWWDPPALMQDPPTAGYYAPMGSTAQLDDVAKTLEVKPEVLLALNLDLPGANVPEDDFFLMSHDKSFEDILRPHATGLTVPADFVLCIPAGKSRAFVERYQGGRIVVDSADYIVQAGEVLGTIAERFEVSVKALMADNNKSDPLVQVGERLRVPVRASELIEETQLPTLIDRSDRFDRAYRAILAADYYTAVLELDTLLTTSTEDHLERAGKKARREAIVNFGVMVHQQSPDRNGGPALWRHVRSESPRAAYLIARELERRQDTEAARAAYKAVIRVHKTGRYVGLARYRQQRLRAASEGASQLPSPRTGAAHH